MNKEFEEIKLELDRVLDNLEPEGVCLVYSTIEMLQSIRLLILNLDKRLNER